MSTAALCPSVFNVSENCSQVLLNLLTCCGSKFDSYYDSCESSDGAVQSLLHIMEKKKTQPGCVDLRRSLLTLK